MTALTFAEVFVGGIRGMVGDLLDKKDLRLFFPLIAGLFCYILACNIQSIFPGFLPPTDNINTNVGMALIVFLTFNAVGLMRDAKGFIKHLAGPALFLVPLMLPLEIVSLFIRPLSLTVRLTANMFGDHQVFTVISGLVPVILPAALLLLACIVSVVQAFVFSLLTVIYIHLSLPHHEHDEAHAQGAHH
jgi:F-type H+-transporting ATPase subunit a